jgi:hypothetical protein
MESVRAAREPSSILRGAVAPTGGVPDLDGDSVTPITEVIASPLLQGGPRLAQVLNDALKP